MGKLKVEYFTFSSGSSLAIYDAKKSSEPLYLETTEEADVYKMTLREGTYGHNGQEVEEGRFEINLSVGSSLHGYVTRQMPGMTKEGEPETIELVLKAE